jgi:hypothetical protein
MKRRRSILLCDFALFAQQLSICSINNWSHFAIKFTTLIGLFFPYSSHHVSYELSVCYVRSSLPLIELEKLNVTPFIQSHSFLGILSTVFVMMILRKNKN